MKRLFLCIRNSMNFSNTFEIIGDKSKVVFANSNSQNDFAQCIGNLSNSANQPNPLQSGCKSHIRISD
jgi:hypothetical protein